MVFPARPLLHPPSRASERVRRARVPPARARVEKEKKKKKKGCLSNDITLGAKERHFGEPLSSQLSGLRESLSACPQNWLMGTPLFADDEVDKSTWPGRTHRRRDSSWAAKRPTPEDEEGEEGRKINLFSFCPLLTQSAGPLRRPWRVALARRPGLLALSPRPRAPTTAMHFKFARGEAGRGHREAAGFFTLVRASLVAVIVAFFPFSAEAVAGATDARRHSRRARQRQRRRRRHSPRSLSRRHRQFNLNVVESEFPSTVLLPRRRKGRKTILALLSFQGESGISALPSQSRTRRLLQSTNGSIFPSPRIFILEMETVWRSGKTLSLSSLQNMLYSSRQLSAGLPSLSNGSPDINSPSPQWASRGRGREGVREKAGIN